MEAYDRGRMGEQIAQEYLQKKGYEILETNWHSSHLEIDIIAKIGKMLVIVEVKTRDWTTIVPIEQTVTLKKMKFLVRAAHHYIIENNINLDTRFDVITIIVNQDGSYELNHIEDAFLPPLNA